MNEANQIKNVSINLIVPNKYQPRKVFNEASLNELASSIKEYGILNPILVRPFNDKYEIIAGERRYRAAKIAGLTEVPVIIKNVDDNKLAEMALIENLQREDISPIEEAESYEQILNLSSLTEQKLSEIVGKSQSFISNKLRLLKLPNSIKDALKQRKISERHARSLLTVNDEQKQNELLDRIIQERLTVKELDNIINEKEITEQEIKSAIDDIMKSLNISEQKEEKESDNMNNGNFFPNMNTNMQQAGQPATLNSMNMQTMGAMPASQPEQLGVQPQVNTTPNFNVSQPPVAPVQDTPLFGQTVQENPGVPNLEVPQGQPVINEPQPEMPQLQSNPIPNFNVSQPSVAPTQDTPLFGPAVQENSGVPTLEVPQEQPIMNESQPDMSQLQNNPIPDFNVSQPTPEPYTPQPVQDTPLFGPVAQENPGVPTLEVPQESTPVSEEPIYDIPVATSTTEIKSNSNDKINQIQELLNTNGINYKSYSNESGHCIIIEI